MSAVNTLTCANCAAPIEPSPHKRPRTYCGPKCQQTAANARRASTRSGRIQGVTYPHAQEPSGRVDMAEAITIPPSAKTPATDSPNRLSELMDKAHSKVGVNAFEIALIAKMRGISAWAPVSKILAREVTK